MYLHSLTSSPSLWREQPPSPQKGRVYGCVWCVFRCPAATPWELLTGRWPVMSPDIRVTPACRAVTTSLRSAVSHRCPRALHPSHGLQGGLGKPGTQDCRKGNGLRGAGAKMGRILHRAWRSLGFEHQDLAPTSTKASVKSLALSITGKWRPATIFTFSFPGIVSASASP